MDVDDLFDVFESSGPVAAAPPQKRKFPDDDDDDEDKDEEDVDNSEGKKLKNQDGDEDNDKDGESIHSGSAADDKSPKGPPSEEGEDQMEAETDKDKVKKEIENPVAQERQSKKKGTEKMDLTKQQGEVDVEMQQQDVVIIDSEDDEDEENDSKRQKFLEDMDEIRKFLPEIEVKTLETSEGSGHTHCVTLPKDHLYIPLAPIENPVKTYPFKLDHFQERAVLCVDNYQSVLVSAHTSAGKTVVAEYAIAKGLKDNQRVIYTTPIKALSNQKYREFNEEFKDVGLITGDVTINPSASCIIMTTEILRNMLYRGSEIMREVGWVVFDEIHYMRDKERGVVWEETIILLPSRTHYVFLSATIPNAGQFAQWITHLHKQPCNVIHTDYRPVPLLHYIVPDSGEGLQLVLDDKGNFKEEGFNKAMTLMNEAGGGGGRRKNNKMSDDSACFKAIVTAMDLNMAPIITFSFSKKDCEFFALQLSKRNYNSDDEQKLVEEVFNNAIDVLNKEDQKLPQVENLLPLLKRGVGIHHGGLLPLLKETVELLFSEGLLKVLFATETFAMGLNMPAKSVIFTNVRKFDGKAYRWISPGEYIQMSGRAGRRGIDDKGHSIVIIEEKIAPSIGRAFFKGQADPINSTFRLTYNMVLNLMRVPEVNTEYMMEKSFFQFQNYSSIPILFEKLKKVEDEYAEYKVPNEKDLGIATYHKLRAQLDTLSKQYRYFVTKPVYLIPFVQPGRMIYVKKGNLDFGWGAIVSYKKNEQKRIDENVKLEYVVEALLLVDSESAQSRHTSDTKPPIEGEKTELRMVPMSLEVIDKISQIRLNLPENLRHITNRNSVLRCINEVERRFPNNTIPLLDPISDLRINDKEFIEIVKNIKRYEKRLYEHPLHKNQNIEDIYNAYEKKLALKENVKSAKKDLRKAKTLLQMEELKCRKRVLRRLGYCSGEEVIEMKGRVACELSSGDELLLTEMIFNGMFLELDAAKTVALLSCLVCDERSNEMPKLTEDLSGPLRMMQEMARQIAKVSKECKLEIDEEEYVEQFKPFLMDVVYEWCKGSSFSRICEMTDIFEGGIIRSMRRLEELLRQMSLAAKVIGNKDLEDKFNDGVKLIKRDIVFAASLYI